MHGVPSQRRDVDVVVGEVYKNTPNSNANCKGVLEHIRKQAKIGEDRQWVAMALLANRMTYAENYWMKPWCVTFATKLAMSLLLLSHYRDNVFRLLFFSLTCGAPGHFVA